MTVDAPQFLLPLGIATVSEGDNYRVDQFAGCSFFIKGQGWVATCKHNLPDLPNGQHYTCKHLPTNQIYELTDIQRHPTADFAIGRIDRCGGYLLPDHQQLLPGLDVSAMGLVKRGLHDGLLTVDFRYFKGYVTRVGPNDFGLPTGPTLLELSFPSLPGFSGAPLISENNELLGMLFSNLESSIEVFSTTEFDEAGERHRETVHRVLELGLAHPLEQLEQWATELGTWVGKRAG